MRRWALVLLAAAVTARGTSVSHVDDYPIFKQSHVTGPDGRRVRLADAIVDAALGSAPQLPPGPSRAAQRRGEASQDPARPPAQRRGGSVGWLVAGFGAAASCLRADLLRGGATGLGLGNASTFRGAELFTSAHLEAIGLGDKALARTQRALDALAVSTAPGLLPPHDTFGAGALPALVHQTWKQDSAQEWSPPKALADAVLKGGELTVSGCNPSIQLPAYVIACLPSCRLVAGIIVARALIGIKRFLSTDCADRRRKK